MSQLRTPSYRRHAARDLAVVTLNGKDFYLGRYDSPESRAEYERLIGEWLSRGRTLPPRSEDPGLTINELMLAYIRFAEGYYRDAEGNLTRELGTMRLAFRPLKALYGTTLGQDFGPKALQTVRQAMIEAKLSRKVINQRIGYIKRLFAWAGSEELIPPTVYHGLLCVKGLRRGRGGAKETDPVEPVADAYVDAILPFLCPTIRTMVSLQRLTGMRSGELVQMRASAIDMTGAVWLYRPRRHKTAYLGHARVISLGDQCKALIQPYLTGNPDAVLFSPQQADRERKEVLRAKRQTPVQPSQVNRAKRHPKKSPGTSYDTRSYYRAIRYGMQAAEKAGVLAKEHFWHPHQLRHSAAQRIQREMNLEAARAFLGHAKAEMTSHYAGVDQVLAMEVASKLA